MSRCVHRPENWLVATRACRPVEQSSITTISLLTFGIVDATSRMIVPSVSRSLKEGMMTDSSMRLG